MGTFNVMYRLFNVLFWLWNIYEGAELPSVYHIYLKPKVTLHFKLLNISLLFLI